MEERLHHVQGFPGMLQSQSSHCDQRQLEQAMQLHCHAHCTFESLVASPSSPSLPHGKSCRALSLQQCSRVPCRQELLPLQPGILSGEVQGKEYSIISMISPFTHTRLSLPRSNIPGSSFHARFDQLFRQDSHHFPTLPHESDQFQKRRIGLHALVSELGHRS